MQFVQLVQNGLGRECVRQSVLDLSGVSFVIFVISRARCFAGVVEGRLKTKKNETDVS